MNIAVFASLIIIFIGMLVGYKRGLIGIVYGILSWIFIIAFCLFTNPYIASFLKEYTPLETYINESISSYISEKADDYIDDAKEDIKVDTDSLESDESILGMYLPKKAYDVIIEPIEDVKDSISTGVEEAKTQIVKTVSDGITSYIIQGISFAIAFVIAKIICSLLGYLIKKFRKLPVIRGVSGIIGMLLGGFNGLLVIWVIMYIVSISLTTSWGASLFSQIQENNVLIYLYNNNLLVTMIMGRNFGF